MSKIIKMTQDYIEKCKQDFCDALNKELEENKKVADGKITFTHMLPTVEEKANIYFSSVAWLKMKLLVSEFSSEVAWHGLAERGGEGTNDYYITDILVYPQEVTGATVNTDQEGYEKWLMELDDEVFNSVRMQGHSHVNMGTTPSTVDISHQERILEQLDDDMFYIFLIWNKKDEHTAKIYDMQKNILFEDKDIEIGFLEDDIDICSFIENYETVVTTKKYTYQTPTYKGSEDKKGKDKKEDKKDEEVVYGHKPSKKDSWEDYDWDKYKNWVYDY
ncbi:MAG: hypothetical protein KBS82_05425 [Oscillospiraceae bacterium]|nr:hypothetical protein [Candidatus Limimonas egerieequi]